MRMCIYVFRNCNWNFDFIIGPVASSTPEGEQDVVFEAQTTLLKWQENNHPWLELSDVHKGIFYAGKYL